MTSNEGQNALKVEEVVIQKDEPEQEEESVEEEKEQNEEQEQEPKDKKDDNEEEEEVEDNDGNPKREIRLNDEKANNLELDLSPEIKILFLILLKII